MEDHRSSKRRKTEAGAGQTIELPLEIIELILLSLPAKPLCRFKLACKSWNSLISHPDFVAHHFKRRRRLFINSIHAPVPVRPLKQNLPIPLDFHSLNLDEFLEGYDRNNVDHGIVIKASTKISSWAPYVHGSSNGILLVTRFARDVNYQCLVNPSTKESKRLPSVPKWRPSKKGWLLDAWALEFDQFNDYKVINGQLYRDGFVLSVYTLKTRSWRKVGNLFPYLIHFPLDGIMVNGHAHWLARKVGHFDKSLVIVCFISKEEKVREIALPPIGHTCIKLGTFRDCLYLKASYHSLESHEFWVMKEYGVSESWTKMRLSIPYRTLSHSGFWTETHDLMVFNERLLVMYDFNKDEFRTLTNRVGVICGIGSYVETQASLTHRSREASSPNKKGVRDMKEGYLVKMNKWSMMALSSIKSLRWMLTWH